MNPKLSEESSEDDATGDDGAGMFSNISPESMLALLSSSLASISASSSCSSQECAAHDPILLFFDFSRFRILDAWKL